MRCVVQRVTRGTVEVDGRTVGSIGTGFVVFVGIETGDRDADAVVAARKIAGLRVFRDGEGRMNRSLSDVGGAMLVVSQFTLAGDVRKGRRPSFVDAAEPAVAAPLVQRFCDVVSEEGIAVEQGVFGADMKVDIVNDGPVTLWVETANGAVV